MGNLILISMFTKSTRRESLVGVIDQRRKGPYLAAFRAFFFTAFLCGSGGVRSILRSTSSRLGWRFDMSDFMTAHEVIP
jgi:hypothetical protein